MSTSRPVHPASRALLAWMQANAGRARELLNEEARDAEDLSPAGDAAVVAHLRFVAEALSAASPAHEPMREFGAKARGLLHARSELLEAEMSREGEAAAIELGAQFGDSAGDDPSSVAMVERRVRLGAWRRVFLDALDEVRSPAPRVAGTAEQWMVDRQTQLADLIFAMDRRAKEVEIERSGPDAVEDADVVNRIGQAAMLQAQMRFLVEAVAESLAASTAEVEQDEPRGPPLP
ncbi:MAG: hypothetical protein ACR2N6_05965 [Miltoncostaeaceae bacterium]